MGESLISEMGLSSPGVLSAMPQGHVLGVILPLFLRMEVPLLWATEVWPESPQISYYISFAYCQKNPAVVHQRVKEA